MDIIKKFRGWCHKVLPLVYDDSLSYYEFLCKVLEKLNEVIDAVNAIIEGGGYDPTVIAQLQEEVGTLTTSVTAIQTRLTNLSNTVSSMDDEVDTLSNTVSIIEDTVGGITDTLASVEDDVDRRVSYSDLKFNEEYPSGVQLLENIYYNGAYYVNPNQVTSAVRVEKAVPTVNGSAIYFSISANFKPMLINMVFKNGNTFKTLQLQRFTDNVDQQTPNFVESKSDTDATVVCNTATGGCVMDDDFSLTAYTGIYATIVSIPVS